MKKLAFTILTIVTMLSVYSQVSKVKIVSDGIVSIIEAPKSSLQWENWRDDIKLWKDSVLKAINFSDIYYTKPEYQWASKTFSTFFLMANDLHLYDKNWNYNIKDCLDKYESNYGGVDIVLLWATYPQLGFDNRDQFMFYRNLPGGISALRKLCDELHTMDKKLMIAFNPWDNDSVNSNKSNEDELFKLVQEIGCDGIFLDTSAGMIGFRERLHKAKPGAIFQSEHEPKASMLAEIHQGWLELAWRKISCSEFDEVPFIISNRWLEQRHMVYPISRWSHEQSGIIQNSWINGCGFVIWENVFGTVNELNPRDRSLISSMHPIMRHFFEFFTNGKWSPMSQTFLKNTYSSLWELDDKKLWTIINRREQFQTGKILEVEHVEGTKYFDLIAGNEALTIITKGQASIYLAFKPRALGCILAINEKEVTPEFTAFLAQQVLTNSKADYDCTSKLPEHILKPVQSTKLYSINNLPVGMANIPIPTDSVKMQIQFRQRECGYYPAKGVFDVSYYIESGKPGTAERKVKLSPFGMDETLVTNSQFAKFLKVTNYKPKFADNFLKHWINGNPLKEQENYPVTWITIEDARAYANWAGKRLPTEEEWQWAAQSCDKAFLYPWGNQYDSTLCNSGQSKDITDVKKFTKGRTIQGLYDMCGNVWQLTESERTDGYNNYCILRGGAWYSNRTSDWYADQGPQQTNFGAKYLFTWPGLDRCATIGFRCIVDVK